MSQTIKAALIQAAPIPLAVGDGIAALIEHVSDAADIGAELVAFGETFLGGDPLWLDATPDAAIWAIAARRRCTRSCSIRRSARTTRGSSGCRRWSMRPGCSSRSTAGARLLIVDFDLAVIGRGLAALDTDGHHARPDVFGLRIDRRARPGVADAEDGFST